MFKQWCAILAAFFLLCACASRQAQIDDCRSGNWNVIGEQDGKAGLPAQYAERRKFCERQGVAGNQSAYLAGWESGNQSYWYAFGQKDGIAGLPEHQMAVHKSAAVARNMVFSEAGYLQGWQRGNQDFWNASGRADAALGKPANEFINRARDARANSLQVNESAYRQGWEVGLVDFWSQLGMQDAVNGKEFALRKKEAEHSGLKVLEQAYQISWYQRLVQYWRQAGEEDGWGKPDLIEARLANTGREGVFVIDQARSLYQTAWQAQHARYCTNDNAFAMGRDNAPVNVEVCGNQQRLSLQRAYTAGQDYEAVNGKYQRTLQEMSVLTEKRSQSDQRLRAIDTDIQRDLRNKSRKVTEDSMQLDKRRDIDRAEIAATLRQQDRQLEELKRWEDRYSQQMRDIKRDAFSSEVS